MLSELARQNRKLNMSDTTSLKFVSILNRLLPKASRRREQEQGSLTVVKVCQIYNAGTLNTTPGNISSEWLLCNNKVANTSTVKCFSFWYLRAFKKTDKSFTGQWQHVVGVLMFHQRCQTIWSRWSIWEAMWEVPSCRGGQEVNSMCTPRHPPHSTPEDIISACQLHPLGFFSWLHRK